VLEQLGATEKTINLLGMLVTAENAARKAA
jgi:hypothetical protein